MRYALVKDNIVVNVILWDGESDIYLGDATPVALTDDSPVSLGWRQVADEWEAPIVEESPVPTEDPEVVAAKEAAAAELIALGISPTHARTIAGLSDDG